MRDLSEFLEFLIFFGLVLIAVLFWSLIMYPLSHKLCMDKYSDFNPEFHFVEGCMVEVDGRRVPDDALRIVP